VLTPREVELAQERLAGILGEHNMGWLVRRVDDALDQGGQPTSGPVEDPQLRRLVLLIEAAQRALVMAGELECAVLELLLPEAGGRRVHLVPDAEDRLAPPPQPPIVLERDSDQRVGRDLARQRTQSALQRLLGEALESR
jgi:hypothetical protein